MLRTLTTLFVILSLSASSAFADIRYTVTNLNVLLGSTSAEATAINASGQVVGSFMPPGQTQWDSFFYSNGQMTDLGPFIGTSSYAAGINNSGQVIGQITDQPGYIYTPNQGVTYLPAVPGFGLSASGINDSGQIVGGLYTVLTGNPFAPFALHAYVSSAGKLTVLGTLGGLTSEAFQINNHGQIIGAADTSSGATHAFIADAATGTMVDLNSLVTQPTTLTLFNGLGINDAGEIVGNADDPAGHTHGYLFNNGAITEIDFPGADNTYAADINDHGEIVGSFFANGSFTAYVTINGQPIDLNTLIDPNLGIHVEKIFQINDAGQMVGFGDNQSGAFALLLTPVPEPASLALLSLASAPLLFRRHHKK